MADKRRYILVYVGPDENTKSYDDICVILRQILDTEGKYELRRLKHEDAASPSAKWKRDELCAAVIVDNDGGHSKFSSEIQKSFAEYFLNSGKIAFLCNPNDGRQALWLLKAASGGDVQIPDVIGTAYEKFARHQPVAANLQAIQLKKFVGGPGDQKQEEIVDYAVGLVRGESELSYLYLACEDGDTAIFVVSKNVGAFTDQHKQQQKTQSFWRDVLRILRILDVQVLPISPAQVAQRWADAAGVGTLPAPPPPPSSGLLPNILIYTGQDDGDDGQSPAFAGLSSTLRRLIVSDRFEIYPLKHENLKNPSWRENCAALFVDNRDWERRFDETVKKALADYFVNSGKVVMFCDPQEGRRAMWLLKTVCPPEQWPESFGKTYEHFSRNEPIPTDLQAVQIQKHGAQQVTDLSLGLIKGANGAFSYLKCEDGDTAVFVAMTLDDVLKRGAFIWNELLRVVGVPTVASQPPMAATAKWTGDAVAGELTRIVKYINTGASNLVGKIQEGVSKFLKSDDSAPHVKPPNLLVYVGGNDQDEAAKQKFDKISTIIRSMATGDRFTVYRLKQEQIIGEAQRSPWAPNCRVLFVDNDKLETPSNKPVQQAFADYFRQAGRVVFFSNPAVGRQALWMLTEYFREEQWAHVAVETYERFLRTGEANVPSDCQKFSLSGHDECSLMLTGGYRGVPPIMAINSSSGATAVFVGLPLEHACRETWTEVLKSVELEPMDQQKADSPQEPTRNGHVMFGNEAAAASVKHAHPKQIELASLKIDFEEPAHADFNRADYFQHLKTKNLGQVVIYAKAVPSTIPISDDWSKMFQKDDCVVIAGRQLSGVGRGGNQWLSPSGSASFSFSVHVGKETALAKRFSFLQHMVTLAAADAIHALNEALDVHIKWPNDIYYGKQTKIGGVLVKANFVNDHFVSAIGVGINVANPAPTACLNQYLPTGAKQLTVEAVIASTLTRLEQLIDEYQKKGPGDIMNLYYKYWLHSHQEVTVSNEGKVTVLGLDEYGFLSVKSKDTGRVFTVHPDGNSFDMMANLIEGKDTK